MEDMILGLLKEYPGFMSIIAMMGMLRVIFKPLFALIETVVATTPTKKDDEAWEAVRGSKAMEMILWLLDYLASIKLKNLKKG